MEETVVLEDWVQVLELRLILSQQLVSDQHGRRKRPALPYLRGSTLDGQAKDHKAGAAREGLQHRRGSVGTCDGNMAKGCPRGVGGKIIWGMREGWLFGDVRGNASGMRGR